MQQKNDNLQQILKKYKTIFIIVMVILLILFFLISFFSCEYFIKLAKNELIETIEMAEASLDCERILNLEYSENDLENGDYIFLKEKLKKMASIDPKVSTVYITTEINNEIINIVNSEEINSEYYSGPGEILSSEKDFYKALPKNGESIVLYGQKDINGKWTRVLKPIQDENGNNIAILGMDYDTRSWNKSIIWNCILLLFLIILVYVLVLFLMYSLFITKKIKIEKKKLDIANEEIENKIYEIKKLTKKYKILIGECNIGSWEYYTDSNVYKIDDEFLNLIGKENDEYLKSSNDINELWLNLIHKDDREKAYIHFLEYINRNTNELYENCFRMEHEDGHYVWILSRGRRIFDENGNITNYFIGTHVDITDLKKKEEEIQYLNYHDQLTGLSNRRFYEEKVKEYLENNQLPLAIIMADVNGLKLTNDAFGHLSGDNLLRRVAEIIESECRVNDIIARIGGDEFVILLPFTNSEEAEKIVKRINNSFKDITLDGIKLSVSFGWATKKDDDEPYKDVYKRAEYRMYRNKLSERMSKRFETIKVIFKTLQEKNIEEKHHLENVSNLATKIGKAMNFNQSKLEELKTAALMHDIGKIGVEDCILNKRGEITLSEKNAIRRHTEIGYRILSSSNEYYEIAKFVLYHHERWDGSGYPKGLKGEEIPLISRIIAVANSYDVMTSSRYDNIIKTEEEAIQAIMANSGKHFDPKIVNIFIEKVLNKK